LLGRLAEPDEERVEVRLLSDRAYGEEFDILVNELTDGYVAGQVPGSDREQMERYFFASPARREKLRVAAALKDRTEKIHGKRWVPSKELRIAASILIVFGLAFGLYQLTRRESELDKGLAALRDAYREQRPIEPRISILPYSNYSKTRGAPAESSMKDDLRRAELHLVEAVKNRPTPEAHHALGKVYLAQGRSDEAIREFQEALQASPNNAQIYNDLGAASLEKGDFSPALDSFNKALQLDPNLLEARFNRALADEKLSRIEEAKADWDEYLKRDSSSPWALEARRNLERLGSHD
jgi:tetratricopeptide (TPR) repeat protein